MKHLPYLSVRLAAALPKSRQSASGQDRLFHFAPKAVRERDVSWSASPPGSEIPAEYGLVARLAE
jgi:hypothetical protein